VDVAAVRKAHRDVAPDVACCALADAEGSVAEARNRLGQLGYRRELDVVAKAIDVRAVVLAAGPQESFPTSEEELSTIKPIARKSPDRVMQLASVDRMMHPDDKLGAEIATLMEIAAPPRRRKKENMRSFISRNIGGKVRHLGRWRSDLGRDPFAIPGEHHPVSLR
jgi:LmbE family N-acetylglucosaminyl deacetylase